jgi:hypothetical protein
MVLRLVNITPLPSPAFNISLSSLSLLLPPHDQTLQIFGHREITKEKMVTSAPSLAKRGRRKDDDDESRRGSKLEKGKEPVTKKKDADEELGMAMGRESAGKALTHPLAYMCCCSSPAR